MQSSHTAFARSARDAWKLTGKLRSGRSKLHFCLNAVTLVRPRYTHLKLRSCWRRTQPYRRSIMDPTIAEVSRILLELGSVVGLAILARLASRWGFSSIPLYL